MHKLEALITEWIESFKKSYGHNPGWDDIRLDDFFNGKILEAVMACYILDITPPVDFEQALINKPMREKYAEFSAYPEWFKRFMEENLKSFIELYLIDPTLAKDDFAYILEDLFDDTNYLKEVVESRIFGHEIRWTLRDIVFYHESPTRKGPVDDIEEKLQNNDVHNFNPNEYFELYKLLQLSEYVEFDRKTAGDIAKKMIEHQNEITNKQNIEDDFPIFDVLVLGKVTSNGIFASLDEDFLSKILTPKPSVMKTIYHSLKKATVDTVKEQAVEHTIELVAGTVATGGFNFVGKAGTIGVDIALDMLERHNYFNREIKQIAKMIEKEEITLREALAKDLRNEISEISQKNKYDLEILFEYKNFNHIYEKFVNQYRTCRAILPKELKDKYDTLTPDIADTMLFLHLNKKEMVLDKLIEKS